MPWDFRSWWRDDGIRTAVLINLAAIIERADEALLPSVYREVGTAFVASPTGLGGLTLARALAQALAFPLAAYMALRFERTKVIAIGALTWAVATSAGAVSASYSLMLASRAVNGVGLALVIPAIQSLVADSSINEERGLAFGWLSLTSNIGSILGGVLGVLLAPHRPFGIAGWRAAFHIVALVSYALAILTWRFAHDPVSTTLEGASRISSDSWLAAAGDLWRGTRQVLGVRSFQIIVAQGVVGSFPWAAMAFSTMWLELVGFPNATVAVLLGSFAIFSAAGALFGGWAGDKMAELYPDSGRIMCAQFSAGMAVPLSAIMLRAIPPSTDYVYIYAAILSIMGAIISWNGSAANNPIFAEIVPEGLRTSIYALDRTFEMSVSAFAPATVGVLTQQLFGYVPPTENSNGATKVLHDQSNAVALSKGLFVCVAIPFLLCCLIYTLLYWTYPEDRLKARNEARAAGLGSLRLQAMANLHDEDEEAILAAPERSPGTRRTGESSSNGYD